MTKYFEQLTDDGKAKVLALLPLPYAKNKTLYRRTDKHGNIAYVVISNNIEVQSTENFDFKKSTLEQEKEYQAQQLMQAQPSMVAELEPVIEEPKKPTRKKSTNDENPDA